MNTIIEAADFVTSSLTATGSTSSISPTFKGRSGYLRISLSDTWVATVDLEVSFDAGSSWLVVTSYTANVQNSLIDKDRKAIYRLTVSAYTSGTVVARLGRSEGGN